MSVARLQRALKREAKRAAQEITGALEEIARVQAERFSSGVRVTSDAAVQRLASALSRLQAASDLSGRLEIRWPTAKARAVEPEQFALLPWERQGPEIPDAVPSVAFLEAVRDLEEREPAGASELLHMGLEVEGVYGGVASPDGSIFYPHGFTAARAADAEVAAKVKERLVAGMSQGKPTPEIVREIVADTGWARSYSETVVRTNVNVATTAGRFRESERVGLASGFPMGFRYSAVADSDVRRGRPQDHGENHLALDGMTARIDDPIWHHFTPPGGFNCRCTLEPIVGDDVPPDFVQVPPGAAFAPGFGARPDRRGGYG